MQFDITRKIKETKVVSINDLKVGDDITLNDTGDEAIFKVVHISKKYVYFMRKYVLPSEYDRPINEDYRKGGKFKESDLFEWLNTEYRKTLPEHIQQIIDKIFLPKEVNIFGEHIYSSEAESGKQWDYFKEPKHRVRFSQDEHRPRYWWEASALVSDSLYFCIVRTDGSASGSAASASRGLVPCFRIKREAVKSEA